MIRSNVIRFDVALQSIVKRELDALRAQHGPCLAIRRIEERFRDAAGPKQAVALRTLIRQLAVTGRTRQAGPKEPSRKPTNSVGRSGWQLVAAISLRCGASL